MKQIMSPVPDFPQMEKEIIEYWKKIDVVKILKEARRNSPIKTYYDGPITANNLPHYGHTIQWTIKDLIPRYWSMKNYLVTRNMGWDCQGIPVEYEIEKELGFTEKRDIEKYGVEKFNQLCRESVLKYRDSIFYYETRLGRWFDEEDMYYTMDSSYIESMWWSLKELYNKGLLYEGYVVVAYSTRAGTTLSTHEVNAGGYREIEDVAVTLKFPVKNLDDPKTDVEFGPAPTYFLAWTTTPWTVPGNLLLAVGKDISYATVFCEGAKYILAESKVLEFFGKKEHQIVKVQKGTDLVGIEYLPIFPNYEKKRQEGAFKVVLADHATEEEGTGIVHLAPYGAEDFEVLQKLGITIFDYLDDQANFTDEISQYSGLFYKKASEKITEDLEQRGLLFSKGKVIHKVPICWRTDTPLIYRPVRSWYIAVTKIKDQLIAQNKTVNWIPPHVGIGRMETWLENVRDWALSRNRYWGTPLPLWVNDKTGEKVFIGSFEELEKLSGYRVDDPHKPFVDSITWVDSKNGGTFRRVPEVIDVWYDSGSMPFAQYHYPFENQDLFLRKFPADCVIEMYEQARLWFYTLLVVNTALFGKVPYKNVIAHGVMLAKDGKKLSKSKRNFPPMDEVLDTYGGDILRYFILTSPVVEAEGTRFYMEALDEVKKDFFLLLWNSIKYFVTYANKFDFLPNLNAPISQNELDIWILTRLKDCTNQVTEYLDNLQVLNASRTLGPFVTDLSTWYIRRSRERISAGDQNALATLYYVLVQFSRLIAPFLPFISEKMYEILNVSSLTGFPSIHLDFYPQKEELTQAEKEVLQKMENTRKLVTSALSTRNAQGISVKQPLAKMAVLTQEKDIYSEVLKQEVNVKEIVFENLALSDFSSKYANSLNQKSDCADEKWVLANDFLTCLDTKLTGDLELEGVKRGIISSLQSQRKKQGLGLDDEIKAYVPTSDLVSKALEIYEEDIKLAVKAKEVVLGEEYFVEKLPS